MIPRFLLAAATLLLLTACAKDAAKPETTAEAEADTAAVELHFHAISGLNPGTTGQAAPVRVRIFELKNAATFARWQDIDAQVLADQQKTADFYVAAGLIKQRLDVRGTFDTSFNVGKG